MGVHLADILFLVSFLIKKKVQNTNVSIATKRSLTSVSMIKLLIFVYYPIYRILDT